MTGHRLPDWYRGARRSGRRWHWTSAPDRHLVKLRCCPCGRCVRRRQFRFEVAATRWPGGASAELRRNRDVLDAIAGL